MHLALLALVQAAVPLALPEGEDPAAWRSAAELAGLELGPAGEGPWARLEPGGSGWVLVVEDRSGALRRVEVEAAATGAEREELALLASSLLTPLPVGTPPARPPTPATRPAAVVVEPVVVAEPSAVIEPPGLVEPSAPMPLALRVALGASTERGLGLQPVLALGPRLRRGWLELGVDLEISPYVRVEDFGVSRHGAGGELWAGVRRPGRWSSSASLGMGARGQVFLSDARIAGGVVPSAGLLLGLSRGAVGLAVQGDLLLRQVDLLSDQGQQELGRARILASVTFQVGDRSEGSGP